MSPSESTDDSRPFATQPLACRDYGLILVQLALVLVLVWQFQLEERRHLLVGLAVAAGSFAVHARLPARFRRVAFIALSIGTLVLVLGPEQATFVVSIGATLIACAMLPTTFTVRVSLVLALTAVLTWLRASSDAMYWPIVGSIFMFRMIVFLHGTRHAHRRPTLSEACSYFFLLPNAFFPLFPVVDFQTFQESYDNAERRRIYQTGVHWIVVGIGHLLVYRLIWYELLPTPLEIRSVRGVAAFLTLNFALYSRISGQFHLVCGMLHLFGFHLPRTHDCYFLAASFSEIWRRINIYWKDFMLKVFFLPAFFVMRRWGNLIGVTAAVFWVFLWTWLGHSWQVFWLLGEFPFHARDGLLWMGVGTLVALNAVLDFRKGSKPAAIAEFRVARAARHALQVIGVFASVSLFWSYWGNSDVFKMLIRSAYVMPLTALDVVVISAGVLLAIIVGVVVQYVLRRSPTIDFKFGSLSFEQSAAWHLVPLAGMLILSQPPVFALFGERASRMFAGVQREQINRTEALAQIDGYYEELSNKTQQSGPFLQDAIPRRVVRNVDFGDLIQRRADLLEHELIPNWRGTCAKATTTINRWGMRDRERTIVKPRGIVRIAAVGSSLVMGYGVEDDETLTRQLEERLNSGKPERRFEVLNFGVGRYYPIHRRLQIEHKVLPFEPDVVLYFAHQDEFYMSARRIATGVFRGLDLGDPCLDELVRRIGLTNDTSEAIMQTKLEQHHAEILRCIYRRIAERCRAAKVRLVFVYLPTPREGSLLFDPRICLTIAAEAGITTADLSNWWGTHSTNEVLLPEADHHPNALGHRLVAKALQDVLRKTSAQLFNAGE